MILVLLAACVEPDLPEAPSRLRGASAFVQESAHWTLTDDEVGAGFGASLAPAGDLNGDGFGDLAIGAPTTGDDDRGELTVVYGSAGGPAGTTTLVGRLAGAQMGPAVLLGDIDGDGFDDLAVGSPGSSSTATPGEIGIYHGSAGGLDTTPAQLLTNSSSYDSFGFAFDAADINGDGLVDLVVGAPEAVFNGLSCGYVRVFLGDGSGFTALTGNLYGNDGDRTGHAVSAGGDTDGDGYEDMAFGVPLGDPSRTTDGGKAYLYYGDPRWPNATYSSNLAGTQDNGWFGWSVAIAGDLDGDGLADTVVGAPFEDGGNGLDTGCVHVFYGAAARGLTTPDLSICGDSPAQSLGTAVRGAGDFNGDGLGELLVAAVFANAGAGQARLYAGGGLGDGPLVTWRGGAILDQLGSALAPTGDLDGDGFGEVMVGRPGQDAIGEVLIYNAIIDLDGDGSLTEDDCDDLDPTIYPGAEESCDDLDNDCDSQIDEGEALGSSTFYRDEDQDGVGDPSAPIVACVLPPGCVENAEDCDDGDAGIFPGAAESCDEVDEDCDSRVDEDAGDVTLWYLDSDADGWGDAEQSATGCTVPEGATTQPGDCDDANGTVFPGAIEVFGDGVDNDCDGRQPTMALGGGCAGCDGGGAGVGGGWLLALLALRRRG